MTLFSNSESDWQRIDWQILRDGGVELYWRMEFLEEDTQWFSAHDYDVYEFDCSTWHSESEMLAQLGRELRFPEWWGRNLNALNDCLQGDLAIAEIRGAVLVLKRFELYATGPGANPRPGQQGVAIAVLDIIAGASRFHLLNGKKLVALVQTDDPEFQVGPIAPVIPTWNRREWLNANRQPGSRQGKT